MSRKRSEGVRKDQTTSKHGKAGKPARRQKDASLQETQGLFPIVGIGASAGGLDAFEAGHRGSVRGLAARRRLARATARGASSA